MQAQCYGLLLFGRAFSASDISIRTENEDVGRIYCSLIKALTDIEVSVQGENGKKTAYYIEKKEDRLKILNYFGHQPMELSLRINRANITKDCCFSSFLRGAFLACGTVANPESNYHLEFFVQFKNLCSDLIKLFEELDMFPKYSHRKNAHIAYFKESERIEDVLTEIGAVSASLEIMGVKMNKDMRNRINRKVNFETANIARTVNASLRQTQAIEKIERSGGIDSLPEELRELAVIRRDNPDATLQDMCKMLSESLSRSGINHRLKRIVEIAENRQV